MKRETNRMISDLISWLHSNIILAFMPFVTVQMINCIYFGYNTGLTEILSDYSSLTYATSVILYVCVLDNRRTIKIIYMQLVYFLAILGMMFSIIFYEMISLSNKNVLKIEYSDHVTLRIFIILTITMIINIVLSIALKIKQFAKS